MRNITLQTLTGLKYTLLWRYTSVQYISSTLKVYSTLVRTFFILFSLMVQFELLQLWINPALLNSQHFQAADYME